VELSRGAIGVQRLETGVSLVRAGWFLVGARHAVSQSLAVPRQPVHAKELIGSGESVEKERSS